MEDFLFRLIVAVVPFFVLVGVCVLCAPAPARQAHGRELPHRGVSLRYNFPLHTRPVLRRMS